VVLTRPNYATEPDRRRGGRLSRIARAGPDVLCYEHADGTSLLGRPSGTEPKIKVYILAGGAGKADCREKTERFARWAEGLRG
jgi:phosphoglucomutase